jgi:hypothetical protein
MALSPIGITKNHLNKGTIDSKKIKSRITEMYVYLLYVEDLGLS